MSDIELAKKFHAIYERLAPKYGYETRVDTREFDAESSNGRLMINVVGNLADAIRAEQKEKDAKVCDNNATDYATDGAISCAKLIREG